MLQWSANIETEFFFNTGTNENMAFKTVNDMANFAYQCYPRRSQPQITDQINPKIAYAIFIQVFCHIGQGDDLWPQV